MKTIKQLREALIKKGSQKGSNPGGLYNDTDTNKDYYIKSYNDADQAKVEALTGKLYQHMGINTLNPEYRNAHNEHQVVTEWNPHLRRLSPAEFHILPYKNKQQLAKMYHAAVLTKNWDIVGLEHDNILKNEETGDLHAVDHGGAFHYRAQGGPKDYSDSDVPEFHSLRDSRFPAGQVFGQLFKDHPELENEGIQAVRNMNPKHVHDLFANSGLPNWKDLHTTFMNKKNALESKYSLKEEWKDVKHIVKAIKLKNNKILTLKRRKPEIDDPDLWQKQHHNLGWHNDIVIKHKLKDKDITSEKQFGFLHRKTGKFLSYDQFEKLLHKPPARKFNIRKKISA